MIRLVLDADGCLADVSAEPEVTYSLATGEIVLTLAAPGGEVVIAIPAVDGPTLINKLMAGVHSHKVATKARAELEALGKPLASPGRTQKSTAAPPADSPRIDPASGIAGRVARRKAAGRVAGNWRALGRLDASA